MLHTVISAGVAQTGGDGCCPAAIPRPGGETSVRWE